MSQSLNSYVSPFCCVLKQLFPWTPLHPWLFQSFCLLFPRALGFSGAFDEDIPFRAHCSKVSHSLHFVQLWVSVNYHSLEETPLMRIEQCFDGLSLGVILLLRIFSRIIVVRFPTLGNNSPNFPPRVYDLPSFRSLALYQYQIGVSPHRVGYKMQPKHDWLLPANLLIILTS